jgi:carboxypeptidase T
MRITTLIFALLFLFQNAFAQKRETFSRAKILLDKEHTINKIAMLGLATDHGEHKKNTFFVSDFSASEIEQARKAGFVVEIVIGDVQKHYREQNKKKEEAKTTAVSCSNDININVPTHFYLGSYAGYFTYSEMLDILDSMRLLYPALISAKQAVGSYLTIEGRPIYWVRISNNPDVEQPLKPQMLTTSVHHAREPGSLSSNIFYLWYLLENYATDPQIKKIVDNTELYFIPCVNPDGYLRNISTDPAGGGLWRKNLRNNLDGTYGVDLNRNYGYTFAWDNIGSSPVTSSQTYRGTAAFSEPETQAMKWFAENHHFTFNLNYHTYNNALIYPWGHVPSYLTPDSAKFIAYGSFLTEYNHYRYGTCDQTLSYVSNGGSDDWMYGETTTKNKVFAFTPEVGDDEFGFYGPASNITHDCKNNLITNVRTASLLLPYADVTGMDDKILINNTGYLHYNIKRLGIPNGDTFTVSIQPLDSWLTVPGGSKTYIGLSLLQEVADSFSYSIAAGTPNGQQIGYVLKTNNGLFDICDTVRFYYGKSYNISTASTSTLSDFSASGWSVCTDHYYSAPSALKSSTTCGNYTDATTAGIELINPIDLTYSTEAWMRFYGRWGIESKYDYMSIQASIEGTGTWQTLCGEHTRPGTMYQLYHEPVYDAQQPEWVMERVNLNDYLGQKILIKFEMVSDAANNYDGFYVDDLEVRSVQDSATLIHSTDKQLNRIVTYPNPASNSVTIELDQSRLDGLTSATLYDCLGRALQHFLINNAITTISTANLTSGTYILKVSGSNSSYPMQRIQIMK